MRPDEEHAAERRRPRAAIPASVGSTISRMTRACTSAVDDGRGRVRAHAAGVRPAVAVADALVVLGRRRARRRASPSHTTWKLASSPGKQLLEHDRGARVAELALAHRCGRWRRSASSDGVGDDDALARREPVGLDDERAPRGPHVTLRGVGVVEDREAAVGIPWRSQKRFMKALDPSRRAAALRGAEGAEPRAVERVDEAERQRQLGPDDDEVGALGARRARRGPPTSSARTAALRPTAAVPALPGAVTTRCPAAARAPASACSRAPPPTTTTLRAAAAHRRSLPTAAVTRAPALAKRGPSRGYPRVVRARGSAPARRHPHHAPAGDGGRVPRAGARDAHAHERDAARRAAAAPGRGAALRDRAGVRARRDARRGARRRLQAQRPPGPGRAHAALHAPRRRTKALVDRAAALRERRRPSSAAPAAPEPSPPPSAAVQDPVRPREPSSPAITLDEPLSSGVVAEAPAPSRTAAHTRQEPPAQREALLDRLRTRAKTLDPAAIQRILEPRRHSS